MKTKKILSATFLLLLAMCSFSIAPNINAMQIPEGAVIKTKDNPDVYIVKYKNGKQFKRLVLNPQVFESYGHLRWKDILTVSQSEMDSFAESSLVRTDGENDVYKLVANGDLGDKALVDSNYTYDSDSVYTINKIDSENYFLKKLEELAGKFDDIKIKTAAPTATPTEMWAEQEIRDFAYADAKGWTTLISTNSLGEKRYYRKEGSQWVRKSSEAEIQQPYIEPPTLNQLARLIRMCSASPDLQATCENSMFIPGYYSNLAFRNGVDALILEYESVIFNENNNNIDSAYVLPPISLPSYVFSSPPPAYTPPPVYYIPPTTNPTTSTNRIEFYSDPRTNRIYSSSNGTNYFYDLNGRLDHTVGFNGLAQINYDLNGNIDSISY